MKQIKILLIILLMLVLAVFSVKLNAQKYYPFPTKNAVWAEFSTNEASEYNGPIYYGMIGDTIINSVTYHKIYNLIDTTLNIKYSLQFR